jgi:hypothetical protein
MRVEDRGIGGIYLERAAAEELAGNLVKDGWTVERESDVGGSRVDLVARRAGETVFYEFKLAGSTASPGWAAHLVSQQQLARRKGAAFRLVLVRPPRQMDLEIDGVDRMLFERFVQYPPSEVSDIAGHTLIDEVEGVDLTSVRIRGTIAEIAGEAVLGVTLQTGGGEEIGSESFPFTFSATLDLAAGRADEVEVHEVDTTSWYGDDEGLDEEPSSEDDGSEQGRDEF